MAEFNFKAIGTTWQIDIYQELTHEGELFVLSQVKDRIELFDKAYSRFRQDSLVMQMSREAGVFTLPDDARLMFALYQDLYVRTNGLVTPLIGNLLSDAGYDATYSLHTKKELETPGEWDEIIFYEHPKLTMKKPAILDFGAAGKGYLVDLVGAVLEQNNISQYCIDAGGDILHKGPTPIRVGLEHPENPAQVIGVCSLQNGSICGSAGNRRAWGNFTHIIDPHTRTSPKNILAVWVCAKTAIIADAIATCLFFVPAHTLADAYEFEYVIMRSDNTIETSAHFPGELFLQ